MKSIFGVYDIIPRYIHIERRRYKVINNWYIVSVERTEKTYTIVLYIIYVYVCINDSKNYNIICPPKPHDSFRIVFELYISPLPTAYYYVMHIIYIFYFNVKF